MFYKSFLVVVSSVFLVTSTLVPQKSYALVAVATADAPVVLGGVAVSALGWGLVVGGASKLNKGDGRGGLVFLVGAMITGMGLIMLDEEGGQRVQFAELDTAHAEALGVSVPSLEKYNQELDELNAISNSISAELATYESPTIEDSAKLWKEYRENLSPETFEVVVKVVSQI
ncbi:hypothetical protein WDW86_16010 [Bdellovibrionota bacterium FG-2]